MRLITSIPYRLPKLHLVVRSLFSQAVSFKKVILWLNTDLTNKIPNRYLSAEAPGQGSDRTLAIGCAGVLYPPNSLHDDVLNESLFLKLAPKADDFWFKAMSFKRGTQVVKTRASDSEPTPIMFTQKYALKRRNIQGDENNDQWNSICECYGLEIK